MSDHLAAMRQAYSRGGLAEADLALGLRGGAQAFALAADEVDPAIARELYA